jgi:hypothetical protein
VERQRVPQKVNCSSGFKGGATEGGPPERMEGGEQACQNGKAEKTSRCVRQLGICPSFIYLIVEAQALWRWEQALRNAGTFSVVGGGMFLGFATVLLFYLAWPGKRGSMSRRAEPAMRPGEVAPANYEAAQTRLQPNWATDKKEGLFRPM